MKCRDVYILEMKMMVCECVELCRNMFMFKKTVNLKMTCLSQKGLLLIIVPYISHRPKMTGNKFK